MTATNDGCLQRRGHTKAASAVVYLMEELGDARLRCDQLIRYITEGLKLVEASPHRDHFFEVAGHLLHNAPDVAFKLEKALQAVALAAGQIDQEELKRELKPEKVKELERVLEDVRIRQVRRWAPMDLTRKQAADKLRELAAVYQEFGLFPRVEMAQLVKALEGDSKTASEPDLVEGLDKLADAVETTDDDDAPSRALLAATLRRMLGDTCVEEFQGEGHIMTERTAADWKQENDDQPPFGRGGGRKGGPGANKPDGTGPQGDGPTGLGEGPCNKLAARPKDKTLGMVWSYLGDISSDLSKLLRNTDGGVNTKLAETIAKADKCKEALGKVKTATAVQQILAAADEEKASRFEEGKPADPTKNMTPEEAKEWKANTEKNKDKFKKEGSVGDLGRIVSTFILKESNDLHKNVKAWLKHHLKQEGVAMPDGNLDNETHDLIYAWDGKTMKPLEIVVKAMMKRLKKDFPAKGKKATDWKVEAAGDWVAWVEDADGNMRHFEGPMGQAAAKKKSMGKDRVWGKLIDDGGEGTASSLQAAKRNLSSGSSAWFSKLPKADKARLDEVLKSKKASEDEDKASRFEEGKPADPTKNMTPEEAKEWKANTEKNKDKFKKKAERDVVFGRDHFAAKDDDDKEAEEDDAKKPFPGAAPPFKKKKATDWKATPCPKAREAADKAAWKVEAGEPAGFKIDPETAWAYADAWPKKTVGNAQLRYTIVQKVKEVDQFSWEIYNDSKGTLKDLQRAWENASMDVRDLRFRSKKWMSPSDYVQLMTDVCPRYNDFWIKRIAKAFANPDAKGIMVQPARENSPALYIKGPDEVLDWLRMIMAPDMKADDADIQGGMLRLWWD